MAQGTADFYAAIDPVANREFYGLEKDQEPSQFDKIFDVSSDDEPQRSAVEHGGPSVLDLKAENAPVALKRFTQSAPKTWSAQTFAAAAIISFESAEDVKYPELKAAFGSLGRATRMTPEYQCRDFLDAAFDSSAPTGWDALALCSTAHLLPDGTTTTANTSTVPQPLDETGLENVITALRNIKGTDGNRQPQMLKSLIVPSALYVLAQKLSMTEKSVGSNYNDVSVVKGTKVQVFDYLTSNSRWFVKTKNTNGLFLDWVRKARFITDQVPMNLQKAYIAFYRNRLGCIDFRGIWGENAS